MLGLAEHDVLRIYRNFESLDENELNDAQRWLRAQLAHEAELNEQAFEQMQSLAEQSHSSTAWQTLGDWHMAADDHKKAMLCYQQALMSADNTV